MARRKPAVVVARGVTVDPLVAFGRECIAGTRIPTAVVADRFLGLETVSMIVADYDLRTDQVEDALRWECLSAKVRKRRMEKAGCK